MLSYPPCIFILTIDNHLGFGHFITFSNLEPPSPFKLIMIIDDEAGNLVPKLAKNQPG